MDFSSEDHLKNSIENKPIDKLNLNKLRLKDLIPISIINIFIYSVRIKSPG
jgi:hypothetical protein